MQRSRKIFLCLLLLFGIGYASVSVVLSSSGNSKISVNKDDFDVLFTRTVVDGNDVSSDIISDDGKSINFSTNDLSLVGDKSKLDYEVTNNSELYDAEVSIECSATGDKKDYYSVKNQISNKVIAKTKENGVLEVELLKASVNDFSENFTCTLKANAIERTTKATSDWIPKNFISKKSFGYDSDLKQNSVLDYTTIDSNVFAALDSDGVTKGVCVNDDKGLFCIKTNNYEENEKLLKERFGEENCKVSSSGIYCSNSITECGDYKNQSVTCYDFRKASRCYVYYGDGFYC